MLMITHIDNDHIAGALKMLEQGLSRPSIDDLWFNGFRHLPTSSLESMGSRRRREVDKFIVDHGIPWNANRHSAAAR